MPRIKSVFLLIALLLTAGAMFRMNSSAPVQADESESDAKAAAKAGPAQQKDKASDDAAADEDEGEGPLSKFMMQKLGMSNKILKGLMTDDLHLVEQNADKLLKMSHEEKWRASNDMMYLQHSTQFRNACEDLRNKAAKGTMDGTALAWINVTMSCIQCHDWVRNIVLADGSKPVNLKRDPVAALLEKE
ncbi:MAG: hypothetical protein KDA81_11830 [Planctomycetaceae bacterium]|nr:hypothetical protein [Planctomycetaceae bacterium]